MITLKPEHAAKLRGLLDKEAAMQRFVQQVTAQGERRAQELAVEGRTFWEAVGAEYGLDLLKCQYVPNADGTAIKKVAERFE